MYLKEKIERIPYLVTIKRLAKKTGVTVYLVGGFLRDVYLKKEKECFDFDFAIEGDVFKLAREFSKSVNKRLVVLDEENKTYRVVFKKRLKFYNYDFAQLKGENLEEDLNWRDFSINTLCVKINDFPELKIMAQEEAKKDLKKRVLRVTNEKVLSADPLRILRAFSLSARYDLKIEKKTSLLLAKYKKLLRRVSGERINEELFKILGADNSYSTIKKMSNLFIIDEIIPYIKKSRGVFQGAYHHLDVWAHSLETLLCFERLYRGKLIKDPDLVDYLNEELSKNRKRIHIIKLACLLHDLGKPLVKKREKNKTIFHTHEKKGAQIAESIAEKLKFSSKEKDSLKKLVFWHLRPGYLASTFYPSARAIYRFFRDTQDEGVGVILLSLADWRATRGPLTNTRQRRRHERIMIKLIEEYFRRRGEKPLPKIVDGFDIMKKFKIPPSPLVGKILNKIKEEQALGKVRNKREAYRVAKEVIEETQS